MSAAPDFSQLSDADLENYLAHKPEKMSDNGLRLIMGEKPTGALEAAKDTALEIGGGVAGGVGHLVDTAFRGVAAARGEPSIPRESPESYQSRFSAPFSHAPVTVDEGAQERAQQAAAAQRPPGAPAETPASADTVGNYFDKAAGTGPLATTVKEASGDAIQDVGTLLGAGSLARGAVNVAKYGGAGIDAGLANRRARLSAPAQSVPAPIQRAVNSGYEISPSSVQEANPAAAGSVPGATAQRVAEGPQQIRDRQLRNGANTNQIIADHFNLPNAQHIEKADLEDAKTAPPGGAAGPPGTVGSPQVAGRVDPRSPIGTYERVTNAVHGTQADANTAHEIASAESGSFASSDAALQQIHRLVSQYGERYAPGTVIDGQQLMADISTLRERGRVGMRSDNLDQQDVGMAHRQVADALENQIGRNLPRDSQMARDFQTARTTLAQINDAQTALRGTSIDPKILLRIREKGGTLSGPLADVADAADVAPKDVVHPHDAMRMETGTLHPFSQVARAGLHAVVGNPADRIARIAENTPQEGVAPPTAPAPPAGLAPPPGQIGPPRQGEMPLPAANWDQQALAAAQRFKGERPGAEGPPVANAPLNPKTKTPRDFQERSRAEETNRRATLRLQRKGSLGSEMAPE